MWFSTHRQKSQHPPPDIVINHLTLPMTNKQKYLGLVFDSQLTWSDQVSNVCRKMSYYLHLIYTNKFVLPDNIIKLLLESLVMSHLNYALPVWGTSLTQQNISRIQRLQNRAVRLLYHLNKYDHITSYYNRLQWLKFEQLVKFHTTCIMFHYFHSSLL